MSGAETRRIPAFLKGEPLPPGYFDKPAPYVNAPTRNVNLSDLVAYARKEGKDCWSITKEDIQKCSCQSVNLSLTPPELFGHRSES